MQIQIVDNVSRKARDVLSGALATSNDVRVAVAFVSQGGLSLLQASLETALSAGASVEFLIGLDMQTTEASALKSLHQLSCSTASVSLYCYAALKPAGIYHPKLYLFRNADEVTCVVGSSNLTKGGLEKNTEVNVLIKGDVREEAISGAYSAYSRLKFSPDRVEPDEEYVELYARLRQQTKEQLHRATSVGPTDEIRKAFTQKAASLRRPVPTRKDIVGWLALIYDSLPSGEFTNRQVYEKEYLFQQQYPNNQNIRAKIRQQLQELRDIGLLKHLGASRWQKL